MADDTSADATREGESRPAHQLIELVRDVKDRAALARLTELCAAQGQIRAAVAQCTTAMRTHPEELHHKARFIELAGSMPILRYDEDVEYAVVECLKVADRLDCSKMQVLWTTHLCVTPAFHAAYGLRDRKAFSPANKDVFERLSNFKPLFTPCFLLGVRTIVSYWPLFEEFITHVRRHLLEDYGAGKKFTREETVTLAAALAHYAFNTEYILDCTEEEQKKVDALHASIESGGQAGHDGAAIAIVACYAPLSTLKHAAVIAGAVAELPELADVVKEQVADCHALRGHVSSIATLTPIDDSVSAKVQEQYEEFPYPRWKSFSTTTLLSRWNATGRNAEIEGALLGKRAQILIAGCGTGRETVAYATIFPEADILAVDLSRHSLSYAMKKAAEHGISNVKFRQADILRLDRLGQQFDYIVAAGVLHHMRDPFDGWQVLTSLLKPGALMKIGLYSKIARRAITQAQEVRKRAGYGTDAESMKAFRRHSPRLLSPAVLDDIARCEDYFFLSMYRDLLFHVQEHTFDLLQIDAILTKLKLRFVSFVMSLAQMTAYRKQYPDDPTGVNLANWQRFEQENPALFRTLYFFWCRKEDAR